MILRSPKFRPGKQLDTALPWDVDTDGYGSHVAGLIRKVCPYADIYIYRVFQGDDSMNKAYVTEALVDSIDVKRVDIVSMSFGWKDDSDEKLRAVIERARASKVLLFAATSNGGNRSRDGIAYPARAADVFSFDAADVHGKPSRFNPVDLSRSQRLTALGELVKSSCPANLPTEESESGSW
jgi:subtilisin family serine protease